RIAWASGSSRSRPRQSHSESLAVSPGADVNFVFLSPSFPRRRESRTRFSWVLVWDLRSDFLFGALLIWMTTPPLAQRLSRGAVLDCWRGGHPQTENRTARSNRPVSIVARQRQVTDQLPAPQRGPRRPSWPCQGGRPPLRHRDWRDHQLGSGPPYPCRSAECT